MLLLDIKRVYITFKDIVKTISNVSKRNLNFYEITLEQYVEGMKQMQIEADVVWLIEYLFSHVLTNPENQKINNNIEKVLGRKPKTFLAYATATTKTGVWQPIATNNNNK